MDFRVAGKARPVLSAAVRRAASEGVSGFSATLRLTSAEQAAKAEVPIEVIPLPSVTVCRFLQLLKRLLGMAVIASGSVNVSLAQSWNAAVPILLTPSGSVTVRLEQPAKADAPISVTVEGIVTDVRAEHEEKVLSGIFARDPGSLTLWRFLLLCIMFLPNDVMLSPNSSDVSAVQ